jgi:hypothetical protein
VTWWKVTTSGASRASALSASHKRRLADWPTARRAFSGGRGFPLTGSTVDARTRSLQPHSLRPLDKSASKASRIFRFTSPETTPFAGISFLSDGDSTPGRACPNGALVRRCQSSAKSRTDAGFSFAMRTCFQQHECSGSSTLETRVAEITRTSHSKAETEKNDLKDTGLFSRILAISLPSGSLQSSAFSRSEANKG